MGLFDFFRKKNTGSCSPAAPSKKVTPAKGPALTPEEQKNISILTQNRIDEFSQNNIRGAAADALGSSKSPQAIEALIAAAKTDPAWNVRGRSLTALSTIAAVGGETPAISPAVFMDALKDPKSYVVQCAAKALGKMKCTDAIEPLLDIIRAYREGQDFSSAQAAIDGLGEIGEAAVPPLLKEAKDGPGDRGFALRALAATGSPSAFEELKAGMTDLSLPGYEREYIAKGLAKIGTPDAADVLKDALDTADESGLVKTIASCLESLHVEVDDLEAKQKAAEIKAAQKLLAGLKAVKPGMTEDEADDLVGPGNFQMGPNVVHDTRFGSFQLLVSGKYVTGTLSTESVIANIEKWLSEQG